MSQFKVFLAGKALGLKVAVKSITEEGDELVIPGVSVITEGPVVSHFVKVGGIEYQVEADAMTLETILAGAAKYEDGVKVKANHGSGVEAIIGRLTNFAIDTGKTGKKRVSATLRLFKDSKHFQSLATTVKKIPDTIGLSVFFDGPAQRIGDLFFARCSELFSTDLVTEPSANPSGLFNRFEVKVDNPQKDEGTETMTAQDITSACEAALKPHVEAMGAMTSRIAALENKMAAGAGSAQTGGPATPPDEEAMYGRIQKRIEGEVATIVQSSVRTMHELGLTFGKGPNSSIEKEVLPPKKVEDMTFNQLLEHEFSLPKNAERLKTAEGRYALVRALNLANPAKVKAQLFEKDLVSGNFVGIRVPEVA